MWYLKSKFNRSTTSKIRDSDIFEHFAIIKTILEISSSRIFNLNEILFKIEFEKAYKFINKLAQEDDELKERLDADGACAEGVVLNYMFNTLKYADDFDVVLALFPYRLNRHYDIEDRLDDAEKPIKDKRYRLSFIPELQVCIKNKDCISDEYEKHECNDKLEDYTKTLYDNYLDKTLY
ncbi:hypothetical protein [Methanococcus maripaludis]|uniref:Uncharacterized protein n=1 Tax=Methanococcus maripaludis TaxID=39152 RepID=A0A7J9S397_METMI|nr:hypothetical protein [Methanococcus maripaludis]MBB6068190.1 hypothetical protein [Methanococcus maripaludis]